jgi:hypothetical protein
MLGNIVEAFLRQPVNDQLKVTVQLWKLPYIYDDVTWIPRSEAIRHLTNGRTESELLEHGRA